MNEKNKRNKKVRSHTKVKGKRYDERKAKNKGRKVMFIKLLRNAMLSVSAYFTFHIPNTSKGDWNSVYQAWEKKNLKQRSLVTTGGFCNNKWRQVKERWKRRIAVEGTREEEKKRKVKEEKSQEKKQKKRRKDKMSVISSLQQGQNLQPDVDMDYRNWVRTSSDTLVFEGKIQNQLYTWMRGPLFWAPDLFSRFGYWRLSIHIEV